MMSHKLCFNGEKWIITHKLSPLPLRIWSIVGHILTFYDGSQLQYTHLRASMLFAPGRVLSLGHPAQWRNEGEELRMPQEHAAYLAKLNYKATKKDLTLSTVPRHDDPLSRPRLSYLTGGKGSSKTTRAIELFRQRDPLVFTPANRLAKEMRARGVKAQTYHSFSRWSGQTE